MKTKGLRVKWWDGKMEHMKRHEISEKQWNKIRDKFPPEKKPQGGRPGKSNREMLNGILYWLNTGIPWRDLPERFGPWQSVYSRFRAWTKAGIWEDGSLSSCRCMPCPYPFWVILMVLKQTLTFNLLQSTYFQFNGLTCIIFSVTSPEVQIFFPQATDKVSAEVVVAQGISWFLWEITICWR